MTIDVQFITLPRDLARRLRLRSGDGLLSCGKMILPVRFGVTAAAGSVEMSLFLWNSIGLQDVTPSWLGLYRGPEGVPHLGPVVAAVSSFPPAALPSENQLAFAGLTYSSRERGVLFYVTVPEKLDFASRRAGGFVLGPVGQEGDPPDWREVALPLPDVVINQITAVGPGQTEAYRRLGQEYAARPGGYPQFLTKGWLDKERAFRLLAADSLAARYVPCTVTLAAGSTEVLWEMLDRFGQVFLKPTRGSAGLNILRLTNTPPHFLAEYRLGDRNIARVCDSKDEVRALIEPALGHSDYVCQQAIARPEVDGGPVDFRIALGRNGRGRWEPFYYRGRRAQPGAICTNRSYGGVWGPIDDLLDKVFPRSTHEMKEALIRCALDVARAVSGPEAGDCCLIALDIALDHQGHPWLLEVNDRPNLGGGRTAAGKFAIWMMSELMLSYSILVAGGTDRTLVWPLPTLDP